MEALFSIVIGIIAVALAVMDMDWMYEFRRTKFFVSLIGRQGVRIVMGIAGIMLIIGSFAAGGS